MIWSNSGDFSAIINHVKRNPFLIHAEMVPCHGSGVSIALGDSVNVLCVRANKAHIQLTVGYFWISRQSFCCLTRVFLNNLFIMGFQHDSYKMQQQVGCNISIRFSYFRASNSNLGLRDTSTTITIQQKRGLRKTLPSQGLNCSFRGTKQNYPRCKVFLRSIELLSFLLASLSIFNCIH